MTDLKETEILDEISGSAELSLFFKRLFTNLDYQKLFFLHREHLFPSVGTNIVPLIFWHNLEDSENSEAALSVIATLSEMEDISRQQTESLMSSLFPAKMGEYVMGAFVFAILQYVKQNEALKKLLDEPEVNLEKIREIIGKLSEQPSKSPTGDPTLERIGKEVNDIFAKATGNMLAQLPSIGDIFPDPLIVYHVGCYGHLKQLLQVATLKADEYFRLLVDLYGLKVIDTVHTIFWCYNCLDEHQILKTKSNLSPYHMRINCPRCGKLMAVSTILELDPTIHDGIFSKDGLLGITVAWFLQNNKLKVDLQAYNEHEYDMICYTKKGNVLIECKMHRKPDERLLRNWLQQDLKQLNEHLTTAKEKHDVSRGMLIYNFPISPHKALVDEARNQINKELEVMDYTSVQSFVDSIKS